MPSSVGSFMLRRLCSGVVTGGKGTVLLCPAIRCGVAAGRILHDGCELASRDDLARTAHGFLIERHVGTGKQRGAERLARFHHMMQIGARVLRSGTRTLGIE